MSSKDGRQKQLDAREEQWAKAQMESTKCDMLVYKQLVFELKTVLKTEKDKNVKKALIMEIRVNEDIIKTMICSGVSDVPLPTEIELQIMVDKSKIGTQTGSKSPRTRSQAGTEEANKKTEEGGGRQGRKVARQSKSGEMHEDENDKVKNHSNCQREKETEQVEHETEGEKAKIRQRQVKADTMDLFKLPDFEDDDDKDDDYELPVRRRKRGKAAPLLLDDEDEEVEDKADDDNEEEDENNGDDNDEEQDEDYKIDNEEENDDEEQDDDEEEDDEDITFQTGKAEERKQKRHTAAAKDKDRDVVVGRGEPWVWSMLCKC